MTIDLLLREHRNIDLLLTFLQRELEVFEHGTRPDYEVIRAILSYFEVYPAMYHHPQEDLIFSKLETRDPDAMSAISHMNTRKSSTVCTTPFKLLMGPRGS
ncbi:MULTISPECIES: hemerythrin domain-containing protein [Bradyrhizobium]|uniref:Hemerythrin domain-containing protein n=1 Tax=Bradyrhizobium septentrionale TaxID=1404411 RepID=A0ABZ2NVZ4_9BRAD